MKRHESLRTTYHVDAHGDPIQVVHRAVGAPSVPRIPAGEPESLQRFVSQGFQLEHDWQFRSAIVTDNKAATHLLVVVHHLAADGWALRILKEEFMTLIGGGHLPPPSSQPLNHYAQEHLPSGLSANKRALVYWRNELELMPATLLPRSRSISSDNYRVAHLNSEHMFDALAVLAARYRVSPSTVLLGIYAVVMAFYTGHKRLPVLNVVSNRVGDNLQRVVGCFASHVVVAVDTSKVRTFSELVTVTFRSELVSLRYSKYDFASLVETIVHISSQFGKTIRTGVKFNYHGPTQDELASRVDRSKPKRAQMAATEIEWEPTLDRAADGSLLWGDIDFYLSSHSGSPGLGMMLHVNLAVVPLSNAESVLRAIERIAVLQAAQREDLQIPQIRIAAEVDTKPDALRMPAPSGKPVPQCHDETTRATKDVKGKADGTERAARCGALREAVRRANGLRAVDMAVNYTEAGGRAARLVAVRRELASLGYSGPKIDDFLSTSPLASVADRCFPFH